MRASDLVIARWSKSRPAVGCLAVAVHQAREPIGRSGDRNRFERALLRSATVRSRRYSPDGRRFPAHRSGFSPREWVQPTRAGSAHKRGLQLTQAMSRTVGARRKRWLPIDPEDTMSRGFWFSGRKQRLWLDKHNAKRGRLQLWSAGGQSKGL